jgi:uncharacterized small protein (DUF1192 family)
MQVFSSIYFIREISETYSAGTEFPLDPIFSLWLTLPRFQSNEHAGPENTFPQVPFSSLGNPSPAMSEDENSGIDRPSRMGVPRSVTLELERESKNEISVRTSRDRLRMNVRRGEMRQASLAGRADLSSTKMNLLLLCFLVFACLTASSVLASGRGNDRAASPGFVKEFEATQADALQALHEVLEDQIIHGTLIFDKQPILTGAAVVESTPLFERWQGPGQVFYKIRKDAIAPRHFLESADQGTIAVRYVLSDAGNGRFRLRIDAIYVESTRRKWHPSDLTVETSEYKEFQDHLQAIQVAAQEAADAKRRLESAELVRQTVIRQREDETTRLAVAQSSVQDLEQRITTLRHELERRVKAPGADLKAAPFRSAANVKTLAAYTEVVVVIVTPHWFGVETPDRQRGWMPADQLEVLP